MRALLSIVIALALMSGAWAQESCTTCDDPKFPEAVAFLQAQGFPAGQYSVLMVWNEASPKDPLRMVAGYHVLSADASEAFDLYCDESGTLLDDAQLSKLGIQPKNWDLNPESRNAEAAPVLPKAVASAAAPIGVPGATVDLPPVDMAAIAREDEQGISVPQKGVVRIGVYRMLDAPIEVTSSTATAGSWQELPNGTRVWSASIHSPDAKAQRVHFATIDVPPGVRLVVHNPASPKEAYGPYDGPSPPGNERWSASCFSDTVAIECAVPAGVDASALRLKIDRIAHVYRGFDTLPWAKAAGSCNLDVSCYLEWSAAASGVAGIGTLGLTGFLWCTGSLVVDTDTATNIPYFLTANHCVSGPTGYRGADSIEVYWLYQTSSCDGAPPNPASVPRTTGGADYLAGSRRYDPVTGLVTGNDFTLLRLRGTPPSGVSYLGWTILTQPVGPQVAPIHHPSGDYKRIAFGTLTDRFNVDAALYVEATYSAGTTEHGSSGCPLLLQNSQQIVGQLWGGTAACVLPDDPDYYGRFSVTYPVIRSYLDPSTPYPYVDFSTSKISVDESAGVAQITVAVDRTPGDAVRVKCSTSNGTAAAGSDYEARSTTLVFEGTSLQQTFTIPIFNDTHTEADETAIVTLSNPMGCYLAGAHNPVTLTIVDDDVDSDEEGLSDYDETHATYGWVTDPENPDTDSDTLTDYEEVMGTRGFVTDPTKFTELGALSVPYFRQVEAPVP